MCNYRAVMATLLFFLLLALPSQGRNHNGMKDDPFPIEEASIPQIHSAFKAGKLSSTRLVQFYLHRIEKLNPLLHAVIEVNPDSLLLAKKADVERQKAGGFIGGLHGIPVLLKDNIATKDKLNTTAGSFALLGSKVPRDAGVVSKLRKAGAIILGKASLSEWAAYRGIAPSGWCGRSGQTKNPYVLSADPCGSSTGSAVGVAANMVAVSLGTETAGSILCPSGANSVVGIKPTVGLTSRAGVIPISHTQDTVGPICRTVTDAVYLLDEIVGYDIHDSKATKSAALVIPKGGYKQFIKTLGLQGKRLGIARQSGLSPTSSEAVFIEKHLATMRRKGATLVENKIFGNLSTMYFSIMYNIVLPYDFKHDLNMYLSQLLISPVRTLADIISFNIKHAKEEELRKYGQENFLQAQNTSGLNAKPYKRALKEYAILTKYVHEEVFQKYKLHALVSLDVGIVDVLAVAGYPGISVPAGYETNGKPVGIYFGGVRGSEPTLIEIAYAFEQVTKLRKIPSFKP